MKKLLSVLLALAAALTLSAPAGAADSAAAEGFSIAVGWEGTELDLSGLPRQPYTEDGTMMVPLRRVAEALGYLVDWDPETGAITIDDDYIQSATLFGGSARVTFEGKLKVIDLSREVDLAEAAVIYDGCTFVPLEFFAEFLNDVKVEENVISVSPSRAELCG